MAELDRAAISLRLAQARDEAGLTQTELADGLRVHWRSVQNWESPKKHAIPFDLLDEWATLTGVTKEWILHGDEMLVPVDRQRFEALLDRLDALVRMLEQGLGAVLGG